MITSSREAIHLRFPHGSILRRYFVRGFILWLLARLMMTAVALLGEIPIRELARWSFPGALGMLAVCALLGFIDVRIRGERAMLSNLGIDDRDTAAIFLAPAMVGEIILALVMPW